MNDLEFVKLCHSICLDNNRTYTEADYEAIIASLENEPSIDVIEALQEFRNECM